MIIKLTIVLLLVFIIFNLFRAMYMMLSGQHQGKNMSHYLGKRVLFSAIALFLMIVSMALGLIKPNANPFIEHKQTRISTTIQHLQSASTKLQLEMQSAVHS